MKIVVVGPPDFSDWLMVDRLVGALSADDTIVHTGSYALGGKIDRVVKRTVRSRRPRVEVEFPPTPRYDAEIAHRKNAEQLLLHHAPDMVVWCGEDPEVGEVAAVLALAARMAEQNRHIKVVEATDFVRARTQRV